MHWRIFSGIFMGHVPSETLGIRVHETTETAEPRHYCTGPSSYRLAKHLATHEIREKLEQRICLEVAKIAYRIFNTLI